MKIYLLQTICQLRACLSFLLLLKFKDSLSLLLKKKVYDEKKMAKNINDRIETARQKIPISLALYIKVHSTVAEL